MEIIVCAKQVPDVAEAELKITEAGKSVETEHLPLDINEWDNYALEEALLLKEKFGGKVTLITIGSERANELLKMGLAKGADEAIRIAYEPKDSFVTAKLLSEVIKTLSYDLILTGVQASDDGCAQVGVTLAELLGLPHAAIVKKLEVKDKKLNLNRELEGGVEEVLELTLPAVLTLQSGINEPRYASIIGIRRAAAKEIKTITPSLAVESKISIDNLSIPPKGKGAEILTGTPDEVSQKLVEALKTRGVAL